jgi:hypothetical protein
MPSAWMVATREPAALAEKLIAATCAKQGITRSRLLFLGVTATVDVTGWTTSDHRASAESPTCALGRLHAHITYFLRFCMIASVMASPMPSVASSSAISD